MGNSNMIPKLSNPSFKMHSRNPNFVGPKDVLDSLDATLLPGSEVQRAGLRSVALYGPSGIGKTETAIEYARSRGDEFDTVFFVSADTVQKLAAGFVEISGALRLENEDDGYRDEKRSRELVKRWMARPRRTLEGSEDEDVGEASWLLVLDNVDDESVLADFWPEHGRGAVVLTSRNLSVGGAPFTTTSTIELQPLSEEEMRDLQRKLSKPSTKSQNLSRYEGLLHDFDGLPLPITLLACVERAGHDLQAEPDKNYKQVAKKLIEKNFLVNKSHSKQGVEKEILWEIHAIKQIVTVLRVVDVLSSPAVALLRVLSFLDPDRIQENVLLEGAERCGMEAYPKTRSGYCRARDELVELSLVTHNAASENPRIHRLIQAVLRIALEWQEWQASFNGTIKLLSAVWPFTDFSDRNKPARWPIYDMYMPHAARAQEMLLERFSPESGHVDVDAASLFDDAAWYMCQKAANDEILVYAHATRIVVDKIRGKKKNARRAGARLIRELRKASELKMVIAAQGRGDGKEALKNAKDAQRGVLARVDPEKFLNPRESLSLAICYNHLGTGYNMDGNLGESLARWKYSRKRFQERRGGKVLDCTWPSVNLGLVYIHGKKVSKAAKVLGPVYKALVEGRGNDDKTTSETGAILRAMGHLRVAEFKLGEALEFHQSALENLRVTLGKTHFQTADCMYSVAQDLLYLRRGVEEASKLIDDALEAWGDDAWYRPTAARALWQKGRILRKAGREVEAEVYLQKAMQIRKIVAPHDKRDGKELSEADWTELIPFYSR